MARKLSPAEWAWLGLVGYVFTVDVALMATNRDPMTEAWRQALAHPGHRWMVTLAWLFTTKHLFFGNFMPKADPFAALALTAGLVKKLLGGI